MVDFRKFSEYFFGGNLKYWVSFMIICFVTKFLFYKRIKLLLNLRHKRLKYLLKSENTSSKELVNYLRSSKKKNLVIYFGNESSPDGFFLEIKDKINYLVEEITKTKIFYKNQNEKNEYLRNLKIILLNYDKLVKIKNELIGIYSKKFNKDSTNDTNLLFSIWKNLRGEEPINLIDRKWLEIGFQGPDPSTDFRGAGMLALINLHDFVVNKKQTSVKVYKDAIDKTKWYFFAACGVNISGTIIELIERDNLEFIFLRYYKDGNLIDFINKIFEVLFDGFNDFWNETKCFDFMQFNLIFQKFIKERGMLVVENKFSQRF